MEPGDGLRQAEWRICGDLLNVASVTYHVSARVEMRGRDGIELAIRHTEYLLFPPSSYVVKGRTFYRIDEKHSQSGYGQ